jgi:hypothetical protein
MTKREIFIILIAAFAIGLVLYLKGCDSKPFTGGNGTDTLRKKDNVTATTTITDKDLAKHLAELKDYIDRKTLTATTIIRETKIDTTGRTIVLPDMKPHVITLPDGTKEIHYYPTYTKHFDTRWYKADIKADCTNVTLNLKLQDSLTVRHQLKSTGFLGLGKQRLDVEVINHNPYTDVRGLKSFYLPVKRRRFGIGVGIYGGVNQNLKPYLFIGGGLQYNLFRF